jgi:hypothetical protein
LAPAVGDSASIGDNSPNHQSDTPAYPGLPA